MDSPIGLWPFSEMVLEHIRKAGITPAKIEAHDPSDDESPDFIWGELTPHLDLSEGEYMKIDRAGDMYYSELGTRGCCGGDPTFGGYSHLELSDENAIKVAEEFIHYFTRKNN